MSQQQKSAVISIVLSAVIALLAVFGYNIVVVQPQVDALEAELLVLQDDVASMTVEIAPAPETE